MPDVAISVGASFEGAYRDCHVAALLAMTTFLRLPAGSMWASTPTKFIVPRAFTGRRDEVIAPYGVFIGGATLGSPSGGAGGEAD